MQQDTALDLHPGCFTNKAQCNFDPETFVQTHPEEVYVEHLAGAWIMLYMAYQCRLCAIIAGHV